MGTKSFSSIVVTLLAMALLTSACGASGVPAATATSAPTKTSLPTLTPTSTSTPTRTPRPTKTPNFAATEMATRAEAMREEIKGYVDSGYLSLSTGKYSEFPDFAQEWAQIGWYQWWFTDITVDKTFVLSARLKWSSAIKNPDPSGCGIAFGIKPGSTPQVIFVDRSSVLFLDGTGSSSGRVKGTGRLSLSLPAEADFTIIVNDQKQTVLINNEFVGEYSFYNLSGVLGYSVLSGTNKDYGTRCEISNIRLWNIEL